MSATASTFFRSRWVDAPEHVSELDSRALPAGFRAAGVAAGIKPEGLDVGVVASSDDATVYVTVVGDRLLSFCAIDNLWKGAAGQAVQDLNLMLGLDETEGLK